MHFFFYFLINFFHIHLRFLHLGNALVQIGGNFNQSGLQNLISSDPEEAYQVLQATLMEVSTNLNQGIAQVKETQVDMKKVNQEIKKEIQR